MKNIEMVNYVNYIFPSPSSYKAFRGRYEFNDPNKVRWNGIPLPFLDKILDCGADATFVTNKGIELDPDEFIHCDTSNLEDVFNAINSFKEAKQNNPDDLCFIKYASYTNHKPNNIRGGLYVYKNDTFINLISGLPFDDEKYFMIEAVKLDDDLATFIRLITKYFSAPTLYVPKEVKDDNECVDNISDQLKDVKDFNYTEKEDENAMVKEALKEYGLDKSSSHNKDSSNLRELLDSIENPFTISEKDKTEDFIDNIKNSITDINNYINKARQNIGGSKPIHVDDKISSILRALDYKNKAIISPIAPKDYMNMIIKKDLKNTFGEPTEEDKKSFESLFNNTQKFDQIMHGISYPIVPGGYIDLNGDSVEYETSCSDKNWKHMVGFCHELEIYVITATGGPETSVYAFVDKDYHILKKAKIGESYDKKAFIAPKYSQYLIVNSKNGPLQVIK